MTVEIYPVQEVFYSYSGKTYKTNTLIQRAMFTFLRYSTLINKLKIYLESTIETGKYSTDPRDIGTAGQMLYDLYPEIRKYSYADVSSVPIGEPTNIWVILYSLITKANTNVIAKSWETLEEVGSVQVTVDPETACLIGIQSMSDYTVRVKDENGNVIFERMVSLPFEDFPKNYILLLTNATQKHTITIETSVLCNFAVMYLANVPVVPEFTDTVKGTITLLDLGNIQIDIPETLNNPILDIKALMSNIVTGVVPHIEYTDIVTFYSPDDLNRFKITDVNCTPSVMDSTVRLVTTQNLNGGQYFSANLELNGGSTNYKRYEFCFRFVPDDNISSRMIGVDMAYVQSGSIEPIYDAIVNLLKFQNSNDIQVAIFKPDGSNDNKTIEASEPCTVNLAIDMTTGYMDIYVNNENKLHYQLIPNPSNYPHWNEITFGWTEQAKNTLTSGYVTKDFLDWIAWAV